MIMTTCGRGARDPKELDPPHDQGLGSVPTSAIPTRDQALALRRLVALRLIVVDQLHVGEFRRLGGSGAALF